MTPQPPPPPPPPPVDAPPPGARLIRPADDRVVAGVAAGLARRLGVDAMLLRVGFVVLTAAGGVGVVGYAALWALLPAGEPDGGSRPAPARSRRDGTRRALALALMGLGALLLLRASGWWLGDGLVWPLVLMAAGSAVVWARGDVGAARRRPGTSGARAEGSLAAVVTTPSPVRIAVGVVLAVVGIVGFLAANVSLAAVRDLGLALAAATVGTALLLGPWLWRLGTQLTSERRERIRQEERAELAAHLHDSVLQTLALIQRSEHQPRRMVTLARRQERELRHWLYGDAAGPGPGSLQSAVQALAIEIEEAHEVDVEVVAVGDAPLDEPLRALTAAIREACVNAAKHAGASTLDVYVEVEADRVDAFVRDRGRGFDPARVDPDRRGIRDSIVGRLRRHRGSARVDSRPGAGTEVELHLPRTAAAGRETPPDGPATGDGPPPPPGPAPATGQASDHHPAGGPR